MYWPIGAPRIYATSSSAASKDHIIQTDDDAESREPTEGSGSLINVPNDESPENADDDQVFTSGLSTPITPITPGIKPVEHDTHTRPSNISSLTDEPYFPSGRPENDPLLALKISRSGHLFATITSTTLTIWQTKVLLSHIFKACNGVLLTCSYSLLLYWPWWFDPANPLLHTDRMFPFFSDPIP